MTTNRPSTDGAAETKKKPRKQKRAGPPWEIDEWAIVQLQAKTMVSGSTVRRWARGYEVNAANTMRLNKAANDLGLKRKGAR